MAKDGANLGAQWSYIHGDDSVGQLAIVQSEGGSFGCVNLEKKKNGAKKVCWAFP